MMKLQSDDHTKLLIIAPYGIGNLLLLYPVMKVLHDKGIEYDVLSYLKSVHKILQERPEFRCLYRKSIYIPDKATAAISAIMPVRAARYDYSVVSFPSAKPHYNVLSFMCGAKHRIGSLYPDSNARRLSFLNTINIPITVGISDAYQNRKLIDPIGVGVTDEELPYYELKAGKEKRIGFHVGCKYADRYRRWPLDNWKQLIEMIQETCPGYELVMYFGPDEKEELAFFQAWKNPRLNIKKSLPLNQLFEDIGRCSTFLSNDSGLMHISAFMGCRSISIWGPSDFSRTRPFSKDAVIIHGSASCRPCSHSYSAASHEFNCPFNIKCLSDITAEQVHGILNTYLS